MSKLLILFSFVIFLSIGCTTDVKEIDAEGQNSEIISDEESKELDSVDEMLKRDKERLDSMEKIFKEQAEAIKAD